MFNQNLNKPDIKEPKPQEPITSPQPETPNNPKPIDEERNLNNPKPMMAKNRKNQKSKRQF
jgi:hypothetical protein